MNTNKLRKAANGVFSMHEKLDISDLANKLSNAADEIDKLQDFAIWLTGCGYDFCQHEYYLKTRKELLGSK